MDVKHLRAALAANPAPSLDAPNPTAAPRAPWTPPPTFPVHDRAMREAEQAAQIAPTSDLEPYEVLTARLEVAAQTFVAAQEFFAGATQIFLEATAEFKAVVTKLEESEAKRTAWQGQSRAAELS